MSLIKKFNGNMNVISDNLKKYREQKGYSYEMLSYDIECNKRTVKDYELFGIAKVLGIDVNYLLSEISNILKEY